MSRPARPAHSSRLPHPLLKYLFDDAPSAAYLLK